MNGFKVKRQVFLTLFLILTQGGLMIPNLSAEDSAQQNTNVITPAAVASSRIVTLSYMVDYSNKIRERIALFYLVDKKMDPALAGSFFYDSSMADLTGILIPAVDVSALSAFNDWVEINSLYNISGSKQNADFIFHLEILNTLNQLRQQKNNALILDTMVHYSNKIKTLLALFYLVDKKMDPKIASSYFYDISMGELNGIYIPAVDISAVASTAVWKEFHNLYNTGGAKENSDYIQATEMLTNLNSVRY